ncbi:hypothetical protein [Polaromonas sp.]|uniref:hypothetical protein n=1 Tax=Polaromonas sp. TaxID=1869339 RepID=UPI00352B48F5
MEQTLTQAVYFAAKKAADDDTVFYDRNSLDSAHRLYVYLKNIAYLDGLDSRQLR